MKIFTEEVKIIPTDQSHNILQVVKYEEIFFNVYEVEINGRKHIAEKISNYYGNPVISIPITLNNEKIEYPFVLIKGKQEIIFDERNTSISEGLSLIDEKMNEINEHVEEPVDFKSVKKDIILEQIRKAKDNAKLEIHKEKVRKQKAIREQSIQNENRLRDTLEESRTSLVEEFINISNSIKDELVDANDSRFYEIKKTIDNKIQDLANSLNESLIENFDNSVTELDTKLQDMVVEMYESIQPKIDEELTDIATQIVEKVDSIETLLNKTLTEKLKDKADLSIIEKVEKSISSVQKSNIELHDTINKGVQKALSRVGNAEKKVDNLSISLSEKVDSKIQEVEDNITKYYTSKLKMLEEQTFDITEETRKYIVKLVQESRNDLVKEIREIKNEKPIEYIIESNGKKQTKDLDSIQKELDVKISSKIDNEVTRLRKYIAVYSGSGSVATQFADGGTMNGDLTVNGSLNATNGITLSGNSVAMVVTPERTTLQGDGVTTSFPINGAGSLTNPSALIVAIDGAMQEPVVDYTVSGGIITFTSPLANGSKAVVVSPTNTVQVSDFIPSDGSVTSEKLDTNLSLTGNLSINGNLTTNGNDNVMPNQLPLSGNSVMTRTLTQEEILWTPNIVQYYPINGTVLNGGVSTLTAGQQVVIQCGTNAQSSARATLVNDWQTSSATGATMRFDRPFKVRIPMNITMNNPDANGVIVGRIYIGSNGSFTLPFAGSDAYPVQTRGLGVEWRKKVGSFAHECRLFARDGFVGTDGTFVASAWVDMGSSVNTGNHFFDLLLTYDGSIFSLYLSYWNAGLANNPPIRQSSTPLITLSGVGVPIGFQSVATNWSRIEAVVIADGVTTPASATSLNAFRQITLQQA